MILTAQQTSQVNLAGPLFMLALLCVTWFLLMRWRRGRVQCEAPPARIERSPAQKQRGLGDSPEAIAAWEVHVYETARELSGQLDSKMGALQHLVREADRAAARLEKALAGAEGGAGADAAPAGAEGAARGAEPDPAPGACAPPARRRDDEIRLLANYGFDPHEIARRTGASPDEVRRVLGQRGDP